MDFWKKMYRTPDTFDFSQEMQNIMLADTAKSELDKTVLKS